MDVDLTINTPDGDPHRIQFQIADDEEATLRRFAEYARALVSCRWVQSGMNAKLHVSWQEGEPLRVETELPPWDDVVVFLHRFRPICLQNELTFFGKVCNLLKKHAGATPMRVYLQSLTEMFSGGQMQKLIRVTSNDQVINSEKTLNEWLNAYEYHRDLSKQRLLDDLHKMLPLEASKPLFLHLLADRARATFMLAAMVDVVLGESVKIQVRVPQS